MHGKVGCRMYGHAICDYMSGVMPYVVRVVEVLLRVQLPLQSGVMSVHCFF